MLALDSAGQFSATTCPGHVLTVKQMLWPIGPFKVSTGLDWNSSKGLGLSLDLAGPGCHLQLPQLVLGLDWTGLDIWGGDWLDFRGNVHSSGWLPG